jgi:hypothetical protein
LKTKPFFFSAEKHFVTFLTQTKPQINLQLRKEMEERRAEMEPQSPHYSPSDDRAADPSEKVHRWKAIMQEETISARQKEALAEKVRRSLQPYWTFSGQPCLLLIASNPSLFEWAFICANKISSFRIKSSFYPEHGKKGRA